MTLRPAGFSDFGFLRRMANDEAMQRARLSGAHHIGLWEHFRWMLRSILNPDVEQWVAEGGGQRVGEVRVDVHGTIGEVGLVVAPECRGLGYGSEMIRQACRRSRVKRFWARIDSRNEASRRCFASAGWEIVGNTTGHTDWAFFPPGDSNA